MNIFFVLFHIPSGREAFDAEPTGKWSLSGVLALVNCEIGLSLVRVIAAGPATAVAYHVQVIGEVMVFHGGPPFKLPGAI